MSTGPTPGPSVNPAYVLLTQVLPLLSKQLGFLAMQIDDTATAITKGLADETGALDAFQASLTSTFAAWETAVTDLQAQVAAGTVQPATQAALDAANATIATLTAQLAAIPTPHPPVITPVVPPVGP